VVLWKSEGRTVTTIADKLRESIHGADEHDKLKVLVYGEPGVGKTTFAARSPKPLVLDIERGTTSLLRHKDTRSTNVLPYKSARQFEALIDAIEKGEVGDFDTLIVDSFSMFQLKVMDDILSTNSGNQRYMPDGPTYNLNTNMLRAIANRLIGLPVHVILTSAAKLDKEEATGRMYYRPDLTPKLANSLVGVCDVVGYMSADTVKDKESGNETTLRKLTIQPTRKIVAKSRIGGGTIEDPTFYDLLALKEIS
jgi:phage nucleotide-binding protein